MTNDTQQQSNGARSDRTQSRISGRTKRASVQLSRNGALAAGTHAVDGNVHRGGEPELVARVDAYWENRAYELHRSLPLWPWQTGDHTRAGVRNMIKTLKLAFKAEQQRLAESHWAASVPRADAMRRFIEREKRLLKSLEQTGHPPC